MQLEIIYTPDAVFALELDDCCETVDESNEN